MYSIYQAFAVAKYDFNSWRKNPRIVLTFALALVLCFLLSDKAVQFAKSQGTTMQIVEAFVWTFGDSNSILLSSLLMMLLFADMPFLSPITPYYLMRVSRKTWLAGQFIYIVLATFIYMAYILLVTSLVCASQAFPANMWSETAALLGYSGAGKAVALPALVKTLEMSTPYRCMATIFLLMLLYTLVMMFIMLFFNLKFGQRAGVISVFSFSVFGFLLNPETLKNIFRVPEELIYRINVAIGWVSPLNHATYHMHNFGYDLLPRLWHTYAIFGLLICVCYVQSYWAIRKYNFMFTSSTVN